jgi:hypothetical protein
LLPVVAADQVPIQPLGLTRTQRHLQVLYNYCLSKIDSITNDMENGSISFMDMLIRFNMAKK